MAYTLTLTSEERKAFDWVGNRYSNGDDMSNLLTECDMSAPDVDIPSYDVEWSGAYTITFEIPEHVAWDIKDFAEGEDGFWPCFAPELADKMQTLVDSIV